jgi:hypothetical protein
MKIQTVAETLRKTINDKEKMLAQFREDIEILSNDRKLVAYDGEIGALEVTAKFLTINIQELKNILGHVELCYNSSETDNMEPVVRHFKE